MSTREELQARLAAAKAERDEIEEKRQEALELAQLEADVARVEREAKDERIIAEIEAGLGPVDGVKLARLDTDLGVVVLKRANHVLYQRFRDCGEAKTADLEKLVRPCLVHPDKAAFDTMVEDTPAILDRAANLIVKLAGFRLKEVQGK